MTEDYDPAALRFQDIMVEATETNKLIEHGLRQATNDQLRVECVRRGLIQSLKYNMVRDAECYSRFMASKQGEDYARSLRRDMMMHLGCELMKVPGAAITYSVTDAPFNQMWSVPMKQLSAAITFWDRRKR